MRRPNRTLALRALRGPLYRGAPLAKAPATRRLCKRVAATRTHGCRPRARLPRSGGPRRHTPHTPTTPHRHPRPFSGCVPLRECNDELLGLSHNSNGKRARSEPLENEVERPEKLSLLILTFN